MLAGEGDVITALKKQIDLPLCSFVSFVLEKTLSVHFLRVHSMKGVHPFLLLHAVPSTIIAAGAQVPLHGLADRDIFDLNLIAERN